MKNNIFPQRGFLEQEFEMRLLKAQKIMNAYKLDGILITTPQNIRYFTGYDSQFWESPTRPWFVVVPLLGKPIAIVPIMTDATCAIAASYEAKAYGVKTGTMIYEAKKLCPELICVEAKHENYVIYHHKILAEINKYIPIEIIASIDEVACKLTGNQKKEKQAILKK